MDWKQKITLSIGVLAFILMGVFPPMNFDGKVDYKYLPSTLSYRKPFWESVVWSQLLVQWLALAIVITGLLLLFRVLGRKRIKASQEMG